MKRTTGAMVLLAALSGCVSSDPGAGGGGQYMSHAFEHNNMSGCASCAASVPGFQGSYGQPVALAAPYTMTPPGGADLARSMVRQSVPLSLVQQTGLFADGKSGVAQAQFCPPGGNCPPNLMPPGLPGMPGAPGMPGMPGMPGGPNVLGAGNPFVPGQGAPGAVAAVGALTGGGSPYPAQRTEVRFTGPNGMRISWFAPTPDGKAGFGQQYLEAPGRYNFLQAAIYRLKLNDIANRPGVELYPTLEVVPGNAKTSTFLAHSAVPVTFTEEDFNQVASGNYLVKVVYLPDPQFQDLAVTGTDEVISSRLEPGVDPIAEAHRRGNILLVVRLGTIDLEAPNTPAMDAPSPFAPKPPPPPAAGPPGAPNRMTLPGMPQMPAIPPSLLPPGRPPFGSSPPSVLPAPDGKFGPLAPPGSGASDKAKDKPMPIGLNGMLPPAQPAQFTPPPPPPGPSDLFGPTK
jgi:hypothetical protein